MPNIFQKFCLCQQLFMNKNCYMKTRLYNIFKAANAMKAISENPKFYKHHEKHLYIFHRLFFFSYF